MDNVEKGNQLEDAFYTYLVNQKNNENLVFGAYPPELCEIYKKKKYFCGDRGNHIEFDVVIELTREGAKNPHLVVVFECKNYKNNIPDKEVRDLSDKVNDIFRDNSKCVFVVNSPLQKGAENLIKKRKIGLVKYNEGGFEMVLERTVLDSKESNQIFKESTSSKSRKFSAFYDGQFLCSMGELLRCFDEDERCKPLEKIKSATIPFLSYEFIDQEAHKLLDEVGYISGEVKLEEICTHLSIDLKYIDGKYADENDLEILGRADFENRHIHLYSHEYLPRMRFTLGHEIGHFCLNHCDFIRSESVVESDLLIKSSDGKGAGYEKLEIQANIFASCLLLPKEIFIKKVANIRHQLDIRNRGNGYIYVDDQHCNLFDYSRLLGELSIFFNVSEQVIEIKLKKLNMLTDHREFKRVGNIFQGDE